MKLFLHSGHIFIVSGNLRSSICPRIVFLFTSCHGTPTPKYTNNVNSDPTVECGSCLDFCILSFEYKAICCFSFLSQSAEYF